MRKDIKNIEYAIFDMDGTLLDTMFMWDGAADRMLESMGLTPYPETREDIRSMTTGQVAEYIVEKYELDCTADELIDRFNKTMENFYANECTFKEGAKELLFKLKEKGVGMCLATATDRYMVETGLKRNGIYEMFDFIITCTEVGASKVDPEIFEVALERCGSSRENTWVFEDAHFAIKTASKAGFPTLGVYDRSFEAFEDEKKENSTIYVKSLSEVLDMI